MDSSPIFKYTLAPISVDVIDFVYVDMDGVIADFAASMVNDGHTDSKIYKYVAGAYAYIPVMNKATEAIATLRAAMPKRVWFLTKPPANAPYVWAEKALWIKKHFGEEGLHNLIVTMDKSHIGTNKSVLIDDRPHKGGVSRFRGKLIHFDKDWDKAMDDLQNYQSTRG